MHTTSSHLYKCATNPTITATTTAAEAGATTTTTTNTTTTTTTTNCGWAGRECLSALQYACDGM